MTCCIGRRQNSAYDFRDESWASWTVPFGWPVIGIWAPDSDGTDVNAVDVSASRKVIATGDDFGMVKLFGYPAASKGAKFFAAQGHSSHVANVRFSPDDRFVLSVGGHDATTIVWRHFF
eukprot:SAG31_NODE_303_length_18065_cov_5.733107_26_plen_119_part_00